MRARQSRQTQWIFNRTDLAARALASLDLIVYFCVDTEMIYKVWGRAYRAKIMIDRLVPLKLLRAMLCSDILRTNASIGARIDYCDVDKIKDCSFGRARYLQRNVNYANVNKTHNGRDPRNSKVASPLPVKIQSISRRLRLLGIRNF